MRTTTSLDKEAMVASWRGGHVAGRRGRRTSRSRP
ncbi:unnamed protein product [Linum tenue]|uniref:Uncharacterized protein n=2 Tax=Linum tenue TaxID=586396 RepID=A0AAV0KAU6_9ROSI|nr:unnamed protein product [Linum tenue]